MLHLAAKILCRAFFKNVYVSGKACEEPSTIWVANHSSAVVDPALLLSIAHVHLRPIAKNTLWDHPAMRFLVKATKAIPVFRLQDMKKDMTAEKEAETFSVKPGEARSVGNNRAFQAVSDALHAGDRIMIFAEGISHDLPSLQKLKTGVARMALQAIAHAPTENFRVTIQPVTIDYFEKDEFRSDVAVHFCEPIIVTSADVEVGDIMTALRAGLLGGLATFESWNEKRNWLFIFELAHGRTPHSAREFRIFLDKYRSVFEKDKLFIARIQTMRRVLLALNITPLHLIWGETNEKRISFVKLFITHGWFYFFVSAPIQIMMRIMWAVPTTLIGLLSSLTVERDMVATMKIAHGIYIYPLSLFLGALLWALPIQYIFSELSFLQAWGWGCFVGPTVLLLGNWLSEKTDFFRGYWAFASLRFFFPRGWREIMAEWKDISDQCLSKLEYNESGRKESATPGSLFSQVV